VIYRKLAIEDSELFDSELLTEIYDRFRESLSDCAHFPRSRFISDVSGQDAFRPGLKSSLCVVYGSTGAIGEFDRKLGFTIMTQVSKGDYPYFSRHEVARFRNDIVGYFLADSDNSMNITNWRDQAIPLVTIIDKQTSGMENWKGIAPFPLCEGVSEYDDD